MPQCRGVDAAQLEPQGGGLQDIALHDGESSSADDVGIAGAVDDDIRPVGDPARLVLDDQVRDATVLDDAVREPGVVQQGHPCFDEQALRRELEYFVVHRIVTTVAVEVRAAQCRRAAHQLERDAADEIAVARAGTR